MTGTTDSRFAQQITPFPVSSKSEHKQIRLTNHDSDKQSREDGKGKNMTQL